MLQTQKWVNLGLLFASALVFLFFLKLVGFVWELARLPSFEEWVAGPEVLIALGIAAGIGIGVRRSERANQFFNEVVLELSKVTWPLRKETAASSGVVIVLVGIAALLLTLIDMVWGRMAQGILF